MICVYCKRAADSRDHVPSRCLLERPLPSNLITLPSCVQCNRGFSRDEEYFLTILAQIGTARSLVSKVMDGGVVDRALSRSPRLDHRISRSLEVNSSGKVYLNPELDRVHRVIQKIAFGVFVARYRRLPALDDISPVVAFPYNLEDQRPPSVLMLAFTERFIAKRWIQVQRDISSYVVVRDATNDNRMCVIMDFHRTLWGVAYLPNPTSLKRIRSSAQIDLSLG